MSTQPVYTVRRKKHGYVFTCSNPRLHKLLGKDMFCAGFPITEDPAVVVAHLQNIFPEAIVLFDEIVQETIERSDTPNAFCSQDMHIPYRITHV